jgi:hypothetical protein
MRMLRSFLVAATMATVLAGLVAAPSVAALPEFWQKGAAIAGNKVIKIKAGAGSEELVPEFLTPNGELHLKCVSGTPSGEIEGPKQIKNLKYVYTGCVAFGVKCQNTANAGEIVTKTLVGELGYIQKGPPLQVGLLIKEAAGGGVVAEFECLNCPFMIKKEVIGEVKEPINEEAPVGKVSFEQSALGVQKFTKFEGGAGPKELEIFAEKASLVDTMKLKFVESVEVRA